MSNEERYKQQVKLLDRALDWAGRTAASIPGKLADASLEIIYDRGAHGSAELASALFTGQGYVAYGHAKPAPEIEPMDAQQQDRTAREQENIALAELRNEEGKFQVQPPAQEAQAQQATQEAAAPKPQADLAERQDVIAPPRQAADQQQQRQAPRQ